jgi:energy-coupling factor transporter ATP-binding protein EcfA2
MIDTITLKFGSSNDDAPLRFRPGRVTVIVGPNNSGKSLFLRELEEALTQPSRPAERNTLILDSYWVMMNTKNLVKFIETTIDVSIVDSADPSYGHNNNLISYRLNGLGPNWKFVVSKDKRSLEEAKSVLEEYDKSAELAGGLRNLTLRLDGRTRFDLLKPRERGSLQSPPGHLLRRLFDNADKRERLRQLVQSAFPGQWLVIDHTQDDLLRFGINDQPPPSSSIEIGSDSQSRVYHEASRSLDGFSDGVNAFIAISSAIVSDDYKVMLIDEPEAFLSSARQRQLGLTVAQLAQEREGTMFVSTHSSSFLEGCLEAEAHGLNVLRLTYVRGEPTARLLSSSHLEEIAGDPLMRSTPVLDALFRDGAVVAESHSDRVLYQEVARNIGGLNKDLINPDVIFTPAGNKNTLYRIVEPLRRVGVPVIAVVDMDIINKLSDTKDSDYWTRDLPRLLRACGAGDMDIHRLVDVASNLNKSFRDERGKWVNPKKVGIAPLPEPSFSDAVAWLRELADYGLFVVPSGELEAWGLAGASKHGGRHARRGLKNLKAGKATSGFVDIHQWIPNTRPVPAENVWDFVQGMLLWIRHPIHVIAKVIDLGVKPGGRPPFRKELGVLHDFALKQEMSDTEGSLEYMNDILLKLQISKNDNAELLAQANGIVSMKKPHIDIEEWMLEYWAASSETIEYAKSYLKDWYSVKCKIKSALEDLKSSEG